MRHVLADGLNRLGAAVAGALLLVAAACTAPSDTAAASGPPGVGHVAVDYVLGFLAAPGFRGSAPYQCLRAHHVADVLDRFTGDTPFGVRPVRTTVLAITPEGSWWRVRVRAVFANGKRFDHAVAVFREPGRYCVTSFVR
jgi:hypothetical protein